MQDCARRSIPVGQVCSGSFGSETDYHRLHIGTGYWSDGLCACCKDELLCCTSFWLPCVPLGQLYQRVTGQKWSCAVIVGTVMVVTMIVTQLSVANHCNIRHVPESSNESGTDLCNAARYIYLGCSVAMVGILAYVRAIIRRSYAIPACCGHTEDVVCSFCCAPLVTCQLMRHICAREGTRYDSFSSDGVGRVLHL